MDLSEQYTVPYLAIFRRTSVIIPILAVGIF